MRIRMPDLQVESSTSNTLWRVREILVAFIIVPFLGTFHLCNRARTTIVSDHDMPGTGDEK